MQAFRMIGDRRRSETARNLLAVRAERRQCFPSELFDEYAWDLLLHLFIALAENETVSENNLIARAGCQQRVGRRWLAHLVDDGQIAARGDGADVEMTEAAISNMRRFLDKASSIHSAS